ncbi:type II toxin-antitoxin system HicB family antitoxin [Haloarchaeobius sp. DFWS5]|uniref:type II toxin-antitoxin system HicB family antitoxin n=1 Tax=Haloarchaeobius sp. DFWS5 TaxID=3446114 RepID=UPI003EB72F78
MVDAKDAVGNSDNITVTVGDSHVVATDEATGVTSQGKTKPEALANLAEALELYGRPVADEDDVTDPSDAPWL